MSEIDDYLTTVGPDERVALERVLELTRRTVPDAVDGRSYGMPALKYAGRPLIGVVAARDHLSIFPFSPAVIDAVRDRLTGFSLSKGTIRFSVDRAVPDDVVRDIVELRRAEIEASSSRPG
jgi:uncharacterized protein YdhG (YjbR/CyaY superfamily)